MAKFITKAADIFTFVLLTGVLFVNMVKFSGYFLGESKKWIAVAALAVAIAVFCMIGGSIFNALKRLFSFVKKLSVRQMGVILVLFVLATKLFLVFLLDNDVNHHDDMHHYLYFAKQIADTGTITDETLYATMYPYTVCFSLFLTPWVKVFGNDPKALTSLMSILFTATSVLLFDIARAYIGKNKSFVAVLLYNILPIGLFQTQVLVHETVLLFCYALSFWLLLKATAEKTVSTPRRIVFLVLSSLTIAMGANLNLGGIIIMISFVIFAFVKALQPKLTAKRLLNLLMVIVSFVLCFVLIAGMCAVFQSHCVIPGEKERDKVQLAKESWMPVGWVVYLGTDYQNNGVWNERDRNVYHRFLNCETPQEAREYQQTLVQERINSLLSQPLILPKHFYHKYLEMWGVPFLGIVYGQGGNHINDILLYAGNRVIYKGILGLCYLSNILICSVILFSYFKKRKKHMELSVTPELQFKLMFVGIILSLILFEVMNKYVSHLHIILMLLAFFRMDRFIEASNGFRSKLKRKNK